MSRSKPQNDSPNPATRWFEWRSSDSKFAFWDKKTEQRVLINLPFTFILLDRTATIRGYSKTQQSGVFSNEVRDTRSEPFVVRFFNGPTIAEGFWNDIKDKVSSKRNGGKFGVNCYIAYREGQELKIGAIQMTGCALGAWFEFEKAHKKDLYTKAIKVASAANDKTGDVEFNKPVFSLCDISDETNAQAIKLDEQVQEYFAGYFKRPKVQQASAPAKNDEHLPEPPPDMPGGDLDGPPESDDVPF